MYDFIFLLQASEGLSLIKPLTVYGPLGIWAATATFAMYILYKQNQEIQKQERETMIKVTEVITKILTELQTNKEMKTQITQLVYLLNDIKPYWGAIPELKTKIDSLILLIKNND
jgi:hypothetical protein